MILPRGIKLKTKTELVSGPVLMVYIIAALHTNSCETKILVHQPQGWKDNAVDQECRGIECTNYYAQ